MAQEPDPHETKGGPFTSDFSVNEYLLVEDVGYEPLGLVLGSSVYHIGFRRQGRWLRSGEFEALSRALYDARHLAMGRMQAEAADLGADGVVGVRLDVRGFGDHGHVAEFLAVGTAIRKRGAKRPSTPSGQPFTSDLSGQDFWTLMRTGSRPVGLVMGSCVYVVGMLGRTTTRFTVGWRNVELDMFTRAMYDARELAMTRMQHEARSLEADGVVGVELAEHAHGWGGRVVEFFSIGTAIVRDASSEALPSPTPVIDLSG